MTQTSTKDGSNSENEHQSSQPMVLSNDEMLQQADMLNAQTECFDEWAELDKPGVKGLDLEALERVMEECRSKKGDVRQ